MVPEQGTAGRGLHSWRGLGLRSRFWLGLCSSFSWTEGWAGGDAVPSFSRLASINPDFEEGFVDVYIHLTVCILTWKIHQIPVHASKLQITVLPCAFTFFLLANKELYILHMNTSILFLGRILLLSHLSCRCLRRDKMPEQHSVGRNITLLGSFNLDGATFCRAAGEVAVMNNRFQGLNHCLYLQMIDKRPGF